ncbi:hypothetical protein [Bradyrhizobium sp. CER78]|uniref:hypothetical protein n=1 Tax=Bradyrhizobium sp. CER78 TaxID=3039162 RepID=UPI00244704B5|nr:hypothetical protein [Bradyrhizobium sp. CER78]MDH2380830.1 hypothetical protein [Bradyrhizobium sp. CER78]
MNTAAQTLVDVLNQRLQVVQEIASVQSRNLLHRQRRGGIEVEIQRIEKEIGTAGISDTLAGSLADARDRLQRESTEMAAGDAHCAELERRLEELDRQIAAAR